MTVDYSKERVQFGRPIGSFQALKHRMADMLAPARDRPVRVLGRVVRTRHRDGRRRRADPHRGVVLPRGRAHLAGECVQLHGGIAITWEHDAHLVFKRAHALGHLFGAPHHHRASIAL